MANAVKFSWRVNLTVWIIKLKFIRSLTRLHIKNMSTEKKLAMQKHTPNRERTKQQNKRKHNQDGAARTAAATGQEQGDGTVSVKQLLG